MIIQPTLEQTRRINRKRTYSGPGFGPRSFECLGMGAGLGIGLGSPGTSAPSGPQSILPGRTFPFIGDVSASGNTLTSGGTKLNVLADQSGSGHPYAAIGADLTYSASGGPNGNAYCLTNGSTNYLQCPGFNQVAPGTSPTFVSMIVNVTTWLANASFFCASTAALMTLKANNNTSVNQLNGTNGGIITVATGIWMHVYAQFTNSASDVAKVGANSATGVNTGNTAPGNGSFLLVGTAFPVVAMAYGFYANGPAVTAPELAALVAWYTARFGAIQF